MTAVIGILNKSGIALAADSAVTISHGNGRKIYNSAYKIFSLSKYFPVAVMIYNSANFMRIPWEILIKEYKKTINKNGFDKLEDYKDGFLKYLKNNLHLISNDLQDFELTNYIDYIFLEIITNVVKQNEDLIEKEKTLKAKRELISKDLKLKVSNILTSQKGKKKLSEFEKYTFEHFSKKYKDSINESFQKYYAELSLPKNFSSKLVKIIFNIIVSEEFYTSWTGLVFCGYGEKEIYPSCIPLKIGNVVDGHIRYIVDEDKAAVVSDFRGGFIRPFAQRDVIDTILSGIDRKLENKIYISMELFLKNFIELIGKNIGKGNNKLKAKIDAIDVEKMVQNYSDKFQKIKQDIHIDRLMDSIATLSKEDLSELAESLVYLTYLKRRMSLSEESVGGPIDVAILTKGDGFVWIKRKHYFSKKLNQDFVIKQYK